MLRELVEKDDIIYKIPSLIDKGKAMHLEEFLALDIKSKRECINQVLKRIWA